MDPFRVYAESCILHTLGELRGDAERRLRAVDARTLRRGDHWLDVFLVEFSVPKSLLEGIPRLWAEERARNPSLTAEEFASTWAYSIFSDLIDSLEPGDEVP